MDARHPSLSDYLRKSIDIAARRLIGKGGFTADDLDDIRAELTLYALRQLPRHDRRMAKLSTFVSMVIHDAAYHLLRDRFAGKCQQRRAALSLDAPGDPNDADEAGEEVTIGELLDGDEAAIGLGYRRRSRHDQAILRLDVSAVVSLLTDEQRACCAAIMDGRNPTEYAREQGIPRRTFRDRVLAPIRRAFVAAGMEA